MRRVVLVLVMAAVSCGSRPDPLPGLPRVMLWAWERPERMPFLNPQSTGVAFLAGTVSWRDGKVDARPRYQPLDLPNGTVVMAVTRLESLSLPLPDVDAVRAPILETAALRRVQAIQIDFDARASERAWYAGLLRRVRDRLDPRIPLTITALVSWCLNDSWIEGLPVRDAVPMLFRMGRGEPQARWSFRPVVCQSSLGISTDEPLGRLPAGRRLFIFHPRPWTAEAYRAAMHLAGTY